MDSIFEYLDYKKYLTDYLEMKKERNSAFSLRLLARQLDMDASNILKIMQGQRELSKSGVSKFVKLFGFKSRESEYFETLVLFSKSKNEDKSRELFEKLNSIANMPIKRVDVEQYEFYKKWYNTAILAFLHYYPVKCDEYEIISKNLRPEVSVKDVKESIRLLLKLGFIFENEFGGYTLTNRVISSGEEWYSMAIVNFQKETLRLAQRFIEKEPRDERDFSTVTVTLDDVSKKEISRLTAEYRKKVLEVAMDSESPDQTFQINLQLFPVTTKGNKRDE